MNKNLLIFASLLLLIVILVYAYLNNPFRPQQSATSRTVINGKTIQLEVADSPAEREKGLSGRDKLANDTGMLFIFDKPDTYQFWMKDMKIPIDIIYLDNTKVVTIYKNVQPYADKEKKVNNLALYTPAIPVNRVIELNAGAVDTLGLKEGDNVEVTIVK